MAESLMLLRRNSGSSCWVSRLFLLGESSWPPIVNATLEIDNCEWLPWGHQGVQGLHPTVGSYLGTLKSMAGHNHCFITFLVPSAHSSMKDCFG